MSGKVLSGSSFFFIRVNEIVGFLVNHYLFPISFEGPVHFARGYVKPAGFDVPVHLEVCECHIDAKIFYPEAFFIKKS